MTKKFDLAGTDEIIRRIDETLEKLERRIARIERALKPKEVTQDREMDTLIESLKIGVLDRIRAQWNETKYPIEARQLGQLYSRKAPAVGGLDTIFRILKDEGEIEELVKLTGARLFIPAGVTKGMTVAEIELLREHGMRESDIRRYREREQIALLKRASTTLTPEEEAEIERQNAEYVAQIEKQGGLL